VNIVAETSPSTHDVQQTRGVLAVVVMLLLAGVVTILFATGNLIDTTAAKHANSSGKQTLTSGENK
jgi:hypothetical protein